MPAYADQSDAELITSVRAGDDAAYGELWQRHEAAALRLARQLTSPSNAEDLVSEAFARILRAFRQGAGPDGALRPYLFSTVRNINIDNGRSYHQRVTLTDENDDLEAEPASSAADVFMDNDENSAAWRAWASLPESSRTLLWHLVVEEETPAQIAPLIGTTPNGVSSRAVRARERLRQAFLQQQIADAPSEQCRWARDRFGAYVRDALSTRDRVQVQAHLDTCEAGCPAALLDVTDVNQTIRMVIAPLVLGGGAVAGYLAAAHGAATHGTAAVTGHSVAHPYLGALRAGAHGRRLVVGAGSLVAAAAAATALSLTLLGHGDPATPGADHVALSHDSRPNTPAPNTPAPSAPASSPPAPSTPAAPPTVVAVPTAPAPVVGSTAPVASPIVPTRAATPRTAPAANTTAAPVVVVIPPTVTPAALPAQAVITLAGNELTGAITPGTAVVDVVVPAGWELTGIAFPDVPAATCASVSDTEIHCEVPITAGTSTYGYTLSATGPDADQTSVATVSFTAPGSDLAQGTVVLDPPGAQTPLTLSAVRTLTQTNHQTGTVHATGGVYSIAIQPSDQHWTIPADGLQINPTDGASAVCTVAADGQSASCELTGAVDGTNYPAILTVIGPVTDHSTQLTVTFTPTGGTPTTVTMPVNP